MTDEQTSVKSDERRKSMKPLSPELQRLVDEPPARARQHRPALAKRMEELDRAREQQAVSDAEATRLRTELELARQRDQQALGRALAAEEPEPEPELPLIEAELEHNLRRSAAMTNEILEAQRRVAELVLRSKDKWINLRRHIADKAAAYRTAIVALDRARADVAEEVRLGSWLDLFPATGNQPSTAYVASFKPVDPLTGQPEPVAQPQRAFSSVRDDLLRDSEQLPTLDPVQPTPESRRWLQKKNVMVERVDVEGGVHPTPLSSFPSDVARLLPWRS
jgi:hypothetical protein